MKSFVHPTAIIYPNVEIGDNVHIGAYCIIGAKAESKAHWNDSDEHGVIIMDNTIITGHVTIDAGTVNNTIIGSDCFIMKGVHIGHDALICKSVTLSPHVVIGGHVEIRIGTNMGMGSIVHQRVVVPSNCMIGMNSTVTKKSELKHGGVYVGSPCKFIRWNER
jgi:UDP-N-acetylglucosamine acyltransferase